MLYITQDEQLLRLHIQGLLVTLEVPIACHIARSLVSRRSRAIDA